MTASETDFEKLKSEYIKEKISLHALAEKHGVSYSALRRYAAKCGWRGQKCGGESPDKALAENEEAKSLTACLNEAAGILSRATLMLCRAGFEEEGGFNPDAAKAKSVKEYWSALKEAVPVVTGLSSDGGENTLRVIMDADALNFSQ